MISTQQQLLKDGYTVFRKAFSPSLSQTVGSEIERVHTEFSDLKFRFPELCRLGEWSVRSPQIASSAIKDFIYSEWNKELCLQHIGNEADLYWCTTAAKPAEKGRCFPWHQDAGYGEGPKDYLIFWAAFDDVDEENGCLWTIPGSHKDGISEHEYRKSNEDSYAGVFLKHSPAREDEKIPLPVQPGDIVCMDSKLVHATFQNNSPRPRRALIYAFLKPTSESSYLIRGTNEVIRPFLRNRNLSSPLR